MKATIKSLRNQIRKGSLAPWPHWFLPNPWAESWVVEGWSLLKGVWIFIYEKNFPVGTRNKMLSDSSSPQPSSIQALGAFRWVSGSFVYLNPTQKSLSFKVMNCQGSLASKLQNRVQLFSSPETMEMSIWRCPSLGCSHCDLSFCVGKRQSTGNAIQGSALRKLQIIRRSPQNELCHGLFSDPS